MDISVAVGTGPQIIKIAAVIKKLTRSRSCKLHMIHRGQHYDFELSKVFFNELSLPDPESRGPRRFACQADCCHDDRTENCQSLIPL